MYDRRIAGRTLQFEASGGLQGASLIMRDRETDSWWSIMTHAAIGGPLAGSPLEPLPIGEKVQWKTWVARHPDTAVLSIGGETHVDENAYAGYFDSSDTFRDLPSPDDRLPVKEPIFGLHVNGIAIAVTHRDAVGGLVVALPGDGDLRLILRRDPGLSIHASTSSRIITAADIAPGEAPTELLRRAEREEIGAPAGGMDTYWYTWAAANPDTVILK